MTVTQQPSTNEHRIVYIVAGVAVVVLTIIALLTYSSGKSSEQADQKANQFVAAVTAAGGRAPSQEQVVRLFGDDGGAVCDDPTGSLRKATLFSHLMNGAAGPAPSPSADATTMIAPSATGSSGCSRSTDMPTRHSSATAGSSPPRPTSRASTT